MTSLTQQEIQQRQEFTEKLRAKTLTKNEAEKLKQLLEKERTEATSLGDVIALLGIAVLIGMIIAYLAGDR